MRHPAGKEKAFLVVIGHRAHFEFGAVIAELGIIEVHVRFFVLAHGLGFFIQRIDLLLHKLNVVLQAGDQLSHRSGNIRTEGLLKEDANTPSTSDSFSLGAKYTPQHSSPSIEQGKKRIYG